MVNAPPALWLLTRRALLTLTGLFVLAAPRLALASTLTLHPSVDASCYSSNTDWSTAQAAATADACTVNPDHFDLQAASSGPFITRWFGKFDTSPMGAGATITAAQLCFLGTGSDAFGDDVQIVSLSTASDLTITTSDWNRSNFGTTNLATASISNSAWSPSSQNCFTYTNPTILNSVGFTTIGLRKGVDISNTNPGTNLNYVSMDGNGRTTPSERPTLTITYTAAPPPPPPPPPPSPSSGSGALRTNTGSLLFMTEVCDHYLTNGSGATDNCDQWSYALKIPFVEYTIHSQALVAHATLITAVRWFILFFTLFFVARWFYRTITRKHRYYY